MEPFANAEAYRALYDTSQDDARLAALLGRASRDMASELRSAGVDFSQPNADFAADLADVACAMVHRALGDDGADDDDMLIPFGASQFSRGAGSYTASATLANPYGDLFMTEAERRKLGIGLPKAEVVSPY